MHRISLLSVSETAMALNLKEARQRPLETCRVAFPRPRFALFIFVWDQSTHIIFSGRPELTKPIAAAKTVVSYLIAGLSCVECRLLTKLT